MTREFHFAAANPQMAASAFNASDLARNVVALGPTDWLHDSDNILRAAGAEVRRELPPQHHEEEGQPLCVVLVKRGAVLAAAEHGLLRRARQRGLPVASQDWLEQCLLAQRVLPAQAYPFP